MYDKEFRCPSCNKLIFKTNNKNKISVLKEFDENIRTTMDNDKSMKLQHKCSKCGNYLIIKID